MSNFTRKINKNRGVSQSEIKENNNEELTNTDFKFEIKSVLALVSDGNINENEEFMEKDFTIYQKEAFNRGTDLIIQ